MLFVLCAMIEASRFEMNCDTNNYTYRLLI